MRAAAVLPMRASNVSRATLSITPPTTWRVGSYALEPALRETSSWSNEFITCLGCHLKMASSPSMITKEFEGVIGEQLPRSVQALLRSDPEDGVVKNINKWLAALDDQEREVAVDGYVADLLHGCDLDDGITTKLLPQEPLKFSLGTLKVTCKPDHVLRCGGLVDVVTQESKLASAKGLAWGQIVGEMVAAALTNRSSEPGVLPPPVFGIRVVGTRWTFLRAEFSEEYLARLRAYSLTAEDRFPVFVWGGAMGGMGKVRQTTSMRWGLDYIDSVERQQLMRMVVALGREARALAVQYQ